MRERGTNLDGETERVRVRETERGSVRDGKGGRQTGTEGKRGELVPTIPQSKYFMPHKVESFVYGMALKKAS